MKCMYCGDVEAFKPFEICLSCAIEWISINHMINVLMNDGHPHHCAVRQVEGDGECECDFYQMGYNPYLWIEESIEI